MTSALSTSAAAGTAQTSGPVMIQDERLKADSTLFPYEWGAFQELHQALLDLRPALEGTAFSELTAALPRLDSLVTRLAADSLPPLLGPHRQEVRGRIVAMQDALRRTIDLTPGALLAADSIARAARSGEAGGDVERRSGDLGGSGAAGWPTEWPGGSAGGELAPSGGDTTEPAELPGSPPAGPLELYQDSWRDLYRHAETLLHRMREL